MSNLPRTPLPLLALGMLSLVLGTIGLLLFFLPILGVPVSAFALLVGVLATIMAPFGIGGRLRWALAGLAMSATALAVNLAIAYAPGGYLPNPHGLPSWQAVPDRPYVPPPAAPRT
jgi:hypothetical protein